MDVKAGKSSGWQEAEASGEGAGAVQSSGREMTLDQMTAGMRGKIVRIGSGLRSRQKFADVGLVEGAEVSMEGLSPFGGLVRVKVMGAVMSFHREEAKQFTMSLEG